MCACTCVRTCEFIYCRSTVVCYVQQRSINDIFTVTISNLKNTHTKTSKENEALNKKLKEVSTLYSTLLTTSSKVNAAHVELMNKNIEIQNEKEKEKEREITNISQKSELIIKIEKDLNNSSKMEELYSNSSPDYPERSTNLKELHCYPNGSQISTKSTDFNVPTGNEYFVVQKRNTEFLSIPFDSLNDMLPEDILKLLISYKLELANVSRELEDARNELNRVKRINIMNAVPVPCLRRSDSPKMKLRPQSQKQETTRSKYAEKDGKSEKSGRDMSLSSSTISANASKFSTDMFKSTASLMRFKGSKRGPGSVVGSVAESLSSFLGGSVKDDGEDWEDGSQDGSVYSSVQGSVYDGKR